MYRTHNCGELRITHVGQKVTLSGWVQAIRDLGAMKFVTIRDRYGITQLVFDENTPEDIKKIAEELGREFVIKITGVVLERSSKNPKMPTGEIEISVTDLNVLNKSDIPPFTIEDETDGGDDLRMKYRYLDLRRNPVRRNLELRHKMGQVIRKYLDNQNFIEIKGQTEKEARVYINEKEVFFSGDGVGGRAFRCQHGHAFKERCAH